MNAPLENDPQIAAPITDHDLLIIAGAYRAGTASLVHLVEPRSLP